MILLVFRFFALVEDTGASSLSSAELVGDIVGPEAVDPRGVDVGALISVGLLVPGLETRGEGMMISFSVDGERAYNEVKLRARLRLLVASVRS